MNAKREAVIVGLCGGLGSGKSSVAQFFAEHGATVVDADRIAHEVIERENIKRAIAARWGDKVFAADGRVDRAALGRRVFTEAGGIEALNALVHPLVRTEMLREMQAARRAGAAMIVLDVPLLIEAGLESWCDALVFVACPRELRVERVRARHNWSENEIARREARQMPLDAKRERCMYEISNDVSPAETAAQVRRLAAEFMTHKPRRVRTSSV